MKPRDTKRNTTRTRRAFVALTGTATLTVVGLGTTGSAHGVQDSEHPDITFGEIDNEGEWLVLQNEGDTAVDLTGYSINFEQGQIRDQIRQFPDGTTIPAGGSITVETGADPSQDGQPADDPDVTFDFGNPVMNDRDPDTYRVIAPDGDVVARADVNQPEGTTEEPTPTETMTEEPSPTPTEPTTEEPTETPTPEETPATTPDSEKDC